MPVKKETRFRYKDVRPLRECLANLHRKAPPRIQKKIDETLKQFAKAIKDYCECDEKVFIDRQNRFVCLSCGRGHRKPEGDIKLEVRK